MCRCQKQGTSSSIESPSTAQRLLCTKRPAHLSTRARPYGFAGSVVIRGSSSACILLGIAGFLSRPEGCRAQAREITEVALVNRGERQVAFLHNVVALGYG